jgi:hypothetical protein
MKRLLVYSLICFLSGVMMISCERGVKAGREEPETYQPRPAPAEDRATAVKDVQGELISADLKNNTIMIRAQNGMEQTFRFNDQTTVQGLEPQSTTTNQPKTMTVRDLMGKEGSEVTVTWKDAAGAKMATAVTVNQLVSRKGSQKKGNFPK